VGEIREDYMMEKNLTYEQKQEILNDFGKILIEDVRDSCLLHGVKTIDSEMRDPTCKDIGEKLSHLNKIDKEVIKDLISMTITDTIFTFMDMFESNADKMKLLVNKDNVEYDLNKLSDKMGAEITFSDEDGWIQKFSKMGRFIL
jgi:hypothetical protein